MWLKSVHLTNIKSFVNSGPIEFSRGINILVGPNNAGKSVVLRAISTLQPLPSHPNGSAFLGQYRRHDAENCQVVLKLEEIDTKLLITPANWSAGINGAQIVCSRVSDRGEFTIRAPGNVPPVPCNDPPCHQKQPHNFIYPYFSRRKPVGLREAVNLTHAQTIEEALRDLPSKVDYLLNSDHASAFNEICQDTLGFTVSCIHSPGGKQLGLKLEDETVVPLLAMGEGTVHIVAVLVHLCSAKRKLFLIEEIENDLHPTALKRLLDFIIVTSETNQFIISTHSNLVARHLGTAANAKLFSVQMKLDENTRIPTSTCRPVPDDPGSRLQLLESLGYEPSDFYLWKGYLILEESTAERLIRDFFVPFLVRNLQGKLKTIAAQGVDDVEARLSDLMRLFVFIHTTPQYNGRAWVAVDGGEHGSKLVSGLKAKFKSWPEEHFRCFKAKQFEEYYPADFKEKALAILSMPHGLEKQKEKGRLAEEVLQWALADPVRAQTEFNISAKEVLDFLKEIAAKLA